MKTTNKPIIIILSVIIAILIGAIVVISWCYMPIKFEGTRANLHITRLDDVRFDFNDFEIDERGLPIYTCIGYLMFNDEVDFLARVLLYDVLSDMEATDVTPEFDDNGIGAPAVIATIGNEAFYICVACDLTRSFIRVTAHMPRDGFYNSRASMPVYYSVNPDKINRLLNHLISRAEKLHPEWYLPKTAK